MQNPDFLSPLLYEIEAKRSEARRKANQFIYKTVIEADLEEYLAKEWDISKKNKKSYRLKKFKSHDIALEDRVWCLVEKMGYHTMNGDKFVITYERDDNSQGKKQIDVFGCDEETALVIECKSKKDRGRKSLQKDLHETIYLQEFIRKSIYKHYTNKPLPKIIWIYATNNIIWSEPDVERALSGNIIIITENELQYFETFIKHMGPAGKYQILAEFLKNQKVAGLPEVKIPCIKGKIGGEVFYSFVTTPRILLKIAFVNHQALNHPDGRPAYQRMISSARINEIGKYIINGGYFPTNIIVNFLNPPNFQYLPNKENTDPMIKFGWIALPKKFRSAWIIDGQHRLYGYSKLDDKYLDQSLLVLGFEKMDTRKEADLFITINHKQKSVPKSLLVSLLADIRLGSDDPKTALSALASAVVRTLYSDNTSPLFRRYSLPGVPPSPSQNLTISETVNGFNRSMLLGKIIHGTIVPGPLSAATDTETIQRARLVLNEYFEAIRKTNPERWERGKTAYICVNPGIRAHLSLLSEIIKYLELKKNIDFQLLNERDFIKMVLGIAKPVIKYIKNASDNEIYESFSRKFGEGGVKEYFYKMCEIVSEEFSDFGSDEFKDFMVKRDDERVAEADQFIIKLTNDISNYVISPP
ncbi:MAG: DGQHR domain-containing protein [Deltaproteobacteria bacterium]|nr:DGQHR domain-containing protein [Deltaproteobacteria bacterium]